MLNRPIESDVQKAQAGKPAAGFAAAKSLPRAVKLQLVETASRMSGPLRACLQEFWAQPVSLAFFAASTRPQYYWRIDDFHVSQLQLDKNAEAAPENTATLRLSDAACAGLLAESLGERPDTSEIFSFKRLSPLEAGILNELSRELFACCMQHGLQRPAANRQSDRRFDDVVVYLTWLVKAGAHEIGKIILSAPFHAIRLMEPPEPVEEPVPDAFFFHVPVATSLQLGTTRLMLADINALELDDIVVFENSRTDRWMLKVPKTGESIEFPIEIANPTPWTLPYTQELAEMDSQQETRQPTPTRQNLWDNLMIDVGAEFEPVKLPLKQLKQMSEGLVVEVGDLLHNTVCLRVEGKTLASGELVIVGDKFGVRIKQVDAHNAIGDADTEVGAEPAALPEQASAQPAPQEEAPPADEDDFLNDAFGDDDEEEW